MSSVILKRIAELSQPVAPPEAWSFLNPVWGMRQLPDSSALLDSLQSEFTPEQLESSRVLIRQRDNSLVLSRILVGNPARGLFLRRTKDEAPFDVVNQHGSLATDDPPAFESSRDFFTLKASGKERLILTAFLDDDLAVLRMLSLPCTPAAGLAEMTGQQVRRLCRNPHSAPAATSATATTAAVTSGSYQFVVVGCRLAALDNQEPPGLNTIISRLTKAEDAFGFDTSQRVRVWRPTASEFSRITTAVEFADRDLIRNVVWQSVMDSNYSVGEYCEIKSAEISLDYGAARQELLSCLRRIRDRGCWSLEVSKKLEAFNRSYGKSVVDAIIRDAMSTSDSVERSLLISAADLVGHLHLTSGLMRSTQDCIDGRCLPREEALRPEELKERLHVVDGLVKIHRELTRGK